jgi:hypothetical protein
MPRKGFWGGAAGMPERESCIDFCNGKNKRLLMAGYWARRKVIQPESALWLIRSDFAPNFCCVVDLSYAFSANVAVEDRSVLGDKGIYQSKKSFGDFRGVFFVYGQGEGNSVERHDFFLKQALLQR